jgi:hypothetical protein
MIEAGAEIFKARQDRHNSAEYTVWLIYTAMEAARIPDPEAAPVAWRWRYSYNGKPGHWTLRQTPLEGFAETADLAALEVEPLYALNPSPALVGDEDAAR